MNEVNYSHKYSKRWREFESYLNKHKKKDPQELEKLYVELMDDLAYARTNFPDSNTTRYLNQLAMKAQQALYKRSKSDSKGIINFFRYTYPLMIHKHRKKILYSFLILLFSAIIGALSTHNDATFVRMIMGDRYVDMTLENIKQGDPMGVYASMDPWTMFFAIAWNNIKVSFYVFIAGIVFTFGSIILMFQNGVMLGTFQYFFFQQDLLGVASQTIWLHGTIEIFSIVIAGAAGLLLGNSLLFPGTFSRLVSFRKGAREGAILIGGLIPFFILASFIESFITRHYQQSQALNLIIILISVAFILYYFILYPIKTKNKQTHGRTKESNPIAEST